MSRIATTFAALLAVGLAAGCSAPAKDAAAPPVAEEAATDPALAKAVQGEWRSLADRQRDQWRHPYETLSFFHVRPGATILEIAPGGGWWTEILAPYAKATGGRYIATAADLANPALSEGARTGRTNFANRWAAKPELYGNVELVNFGVQSGPLGAPNSVDVVITTRNIHSFMGQPGFLDKVLRDAFAVLKPGGSLGIKEHRANPGPQDPKAENGYVTEAYVIEAAQRAGFRLEAKSEMNANPADTKDHPFGVWTLPPVKQTAARGQPANPAFDRTKYDAIGESDRMTLRFVKPAA